MGFGKKKEISFVKKNQNLKFFYSFRGFLYKTLGFPKKPKPKVISKE